MPYKIHKIMPSRTCAKKYKHYRSYKDYLVNDFNSRCGYCGCSHNFFGGKKSFHIDHFKPHSILKFKPLEHEYSNLVYACQSCNGAKSDTWEDVNGFVDPCDPTYSKLISRDDDGKIRHDGSVQGIFIYDNLKLYLIRHDLMWAIESLKEQCVTINRLIDEKKFADCTEKMDMLLELKNVYSQIEEYTQHLYDELSK